MHLDVKEEGGGRKRNTRRHAEDKPQRSSKRAEVKKSNRPNVHAQTERSSSRKSGNNASAFVKKGKKAERF